MANDKRRVRRVDVYALTSLQVEQLAADMESGVNNGEVAAAVKREALRLQALRSGLTDNGGR